MSEQIGALCFLVKDQKSLDEIRRRAREHAGLRKVLNYLDRVNVLAPKNVGNYYSAMQVYGFLRDREALQRLARQIAASKPDIEEYRADVLKFYQFKDDESSKEQMQARLTRTAALVNRLKAHDKGPAYAAAVESLVDLWTSRVENAEVNADEIVQPGREMPTTAAPAWQPMSP